MYPTSVLTFFLMLVCIHLYQQQQRNVAAQQTCYGPNFHHITSNADSIDSIPNLYIGVLVSNLDYILPYFLNTLEEQIYPKQMISLEFRIHNSFDQSELILNKWIVAMKDQYHTIVLYKNETEIMYHSEKQDTWSEEYYEHLIYLRQSLLQNARKSNADIYLSIDANVILINKNTFQHFAKLLIGNTNLNDAEFCHKDRLTIAAPLLRCTNMPDYANFLSSISESDYNFKYEDYYELLNRHTVGVYPVSVLHTILFINMRQTVTEKLTYESWPGYIGPLDDTIIFAKSAHFLDIRLNLDNTQFYGYMFSPVERNQLGPNIPDIQKRKIELEQNLFLQLKLEAAYDSNYVSPSVHLQDIVQVKFKDTKSKLGFNEIYVINLLRRPYRLKKMKYTLEQLSINAKYVPGVDGMELNENKLNDLGIKQLEGYLDPYHKRPMKFGEVGCFLSHYNIWKEMIEKKYTRILILEDDAKIHYDYKVKLSSALKEADLHVPDWDLLYLGRKQISRKEKIVTNTTSLVYAAYSYWTVAYVLNLSGARKLVEQNPLSKLVPVDEYIPIISDMHPNRKWSEQFDKRNLIVLSIHPLVVKPSFYHGEESYVTDTEDSQIWYAT